jgi:predicted nucleotidyltransferase
MLNDLNPDFQDLIKSLTDQHVEFLVVGAHALAFHGIARYTQDLDIWVNRTSENIHKLGDAMSAFGLPISDDALHQMLEERKFLRFGHEPTKIEVLNFLDGCNFELAFRRASHETLGDVQVAIIGLEDYVATKRASGRPKDASDLSLLRSMIGQLPGDLEST